ncbi:cyclic pyranopterin monophosphate synthase MoaC [Tenuifilum thalassicum]|uniref:Cyclic pyranopterin monophosphate synthase MoaC n=1 Tax=Tenuifilum thalassicum TaxID=2590900 RepID=A0A7D3XWC5_9BACT|nr:cyclic pyranopterin monophosphate synthase MoaC [Tenuifilum thalassicum]QKG80391.1 cyclic pyranopterin monophosphate synthase MoaC [Tenuifilum thalassicum]
MELSHTDKNGKANMVDVGHKPNQLREAIAKGFIKLQPETVRLIRENQMKKGDVLTIAEIAGIQAAKRTPELIPLCHTLLLTKVDVRATLTDTGVEVTGYAKCIGQTGVEMEALTAVSVSLLTVYDMCKAVDKSMVIDNVRLVEKIKTNLD